MKHSYWKILGLASIIFFTILPVFAKSYLMHLVLLIFFFTYLSCTWNILGGFTGQTSIGHALFFGIGAYTSSLLFVKASLSPWIGMIVGGIISAAVSLLIGVFIFRYRIRGVFFAMVTLAFAEIARITMSQIRYFGGSEGVLIPLREASFWNFQFQNKEPYYYISFGMVLIILWVSYLLKKSKYFYYFLAIKGDEAASSAIGVNPSRYKIVSFVISAFFTALSGTFYAQYYMFIEPDIVFGVMISVDMIMRPIIGGMGTILGPVVGSFIMTPLSEVVRLVVGTGKSGVHLLIYSVVLISICIWMPRGILPYLERVLGLK
jgi:branched-chain amino acid transport system permease protein